MTLQEGVLGSSIVTNGQIEFEALADRCFYAQREHTVPTHCAHRHFCNVGPQCVEVLKVVVRRVCPLRLLFRHTPSLRAAR